MYFSKLIFSILLIIIASIIYTPKDFKDSIEIPSINLVENIVFGYSNSVLKQGVLLDPNSLKNTNIAAAAFENNFPGFLFFGFKTDKCSVFAFSQHACKKSWNKKIRKV